MSEDYKSSSQQSSFIDETNSDFNIDNSIDKQTTQNLISPLKILNLCANLSSHTSSIRVQILLNKFLQQITNAPYVFIIPILSSSEEGLIQVIGDKVLDKELRFSITADNIRNASTHGFQFLISDINRDFREVIEMLVGTEHNTLIFDIKELNKNTKSKIQDEISAEPGELTNCSIVLNEDLNLPPIGNDGPLQISFFVCIAGDESSRIYYRYCIYETLRFTIGHLLTAIELDEERRVRGQCQKLLKIARSLLGKIGDLSQLLQGVMTEAKELAGAERCSLFLRDKETGELVSKVFDGDKSPNNEIRIQQSIGIAGHVAETGKLLNIRNAYTHPLFYKGIDEQTGFKTRNILCFPICDRNNIIGVAQLCNKLNGYHFDKCDEEVATAFSTYTGIAIMHALVHKSVQKAEARHKLSQELLIYHMKISEEEVDGLVQSLENLSQKKIPNLNSFIFRTRDLDRTETFQASLQMFADLDFIRKFKIRRDKLARFLIIIQKGYRDTVPYHNWMHAFTVAHFAYALLMNCKLVEKGILSELEALSFLISAFCHDLDHRGTTNSYQMESKSNLARLYSSEGSVNERHHLSQTIYILNDDNSKILDGLTTEQFKIIIDTTKEFILATDLAHHFKILKQLTNLRKDNCGENKHMTMSLLITCCDLSDQIKEWPNTQQVSDLIYHEFFAQGDLERQMGIAPQEMMDRQRAIIPRLQSDFIADVVLPAYEVLANILPETQHLLDIINDNLEHWQTMLLSGE